ncbi:MAG: transcriptional regulator GcvA [Alphaproteobacteria bacterium]|nr:transcriptional regulator GcvA [Alphaproteobacteria bacterium]
MKRKLPPLKAIRAFEAAARLLSFSRAAEELNVTHSAISQQVRHLEAHYQRQLFVRTKSRIELTAEAQILLPTCTRMLDDLHLVSEEIRNRGRDDSITINLTAAFATHWLVPRLGAFQQQFPDIHIRLVPSARFEGFEGEGVDVAIRWGKMSPAGITAIKLFDVDAFPACAPSLLEQSGGIQTAADILKYPLIHDDDGAAWRTWFEMANIPYPEKHPEHFFADSSLALQAAVAGQGVITAGSILAAHDLEVGRLVIPLDIIMRNRNAYYLSYRANASNIRVIDEFARWVVEQVKLYEKSRKTPDMYVLK